MILLDEFYKDLYMNVFKKWICMQENPNYIIKEHKDFIQIESSYGIAEVTFNLYCIIELKVVSKKKNEIDFYLHFQMNTLKHAVSLFNEMLESLLKLSDEAKTKVLLCCSGGLTTSYFAREINEANKLLKNAIEVSAVGYNQLYQIGKQFDIIFLAPQISYLHAQIQSILKEQVVLKIPPLVFARYDVGTMIKDIEQAQIKKTKQIKKEEISLKLKITNKKPIVCLVIYKNKERIHIVYRIYDKETGKIRADLICLADETFDESKDMIIFDPIETWKKTKIKGGTYTLRELLVPIFQKGACVYTSPSVMEIRDICTREKDTLWEESKRLVNPHEVYVDLSDKLYHIKSDLLEEMSMKALGEQ